MAWETSSYLLSLSTSVSATVAGVAFDGCTGSEDMARGKGLPCSPPKGDPTLIRQRHVDRLFSDASPAGRLLVSIMKTKEGCRGERGAKGSLVAM
jgi:hypothetical protein